MKPFLTRQDAAQQLACFLRDYQHAAHTLLLALPRGGVPIAFELSKLLQIPFDIFLVRKLGVPGYEELAMGAIAEPDIIIYNKAIIDELTIDAAKIDRVIAKEKQELLRRQIAYRAHRAFPKIAKQTIILVDDGIATGATMKAAVFALRQYDPARIILAAPVVAALTLEELYACVDNIVCIYAPEPFYGVGEWYREFPQLTDEEVYNYLKPV